jgi:hypothetical protein
MFHRQCFEPYCIEYNPFDILKPPQTQDYNLFIEALRVTFDIPREIAGDYNIKDSGLMYFACDRDLLWRPEPLSKNNLPNNHCQWLIFPSEHRNPISSMYSYLFESSDPYYNSPYNFSKNELKFRQQFYDYIWNKYGNAFSYVDIIGGCLGLLPYELKHEYNISINLIDQKIRTIDLMTNLYD